MSAWLSAVQHFPKEAEILSFKNFAQCPTGGSGSTCARSSGAHKVHFLKVPVHSLPRPSYDMVAHFPRKWLRRPELLCKGVWDARLQQQTDKACTRVMHSKYQHVRMLGCSSRLDKVCTRVMHSNYQHARSTFSGLPCVLCQGLHTTWSHTFSRKWLRRPKLLRKGVWDARCSSTANREKWLRRPKLLRKGVWDARLQQHKSG